jgi:hypothetical protein
MRLASLIVFGSLFLVACTDDGVPNRSNQDPGIATDALSVEPDPMTNCPGSEPKAGENCGPDISDSNSCTYTVGECARADGTIITETVTYCCKLGVWEACGGRSCPTSDVDAAAPTPVFADASVLDTSVDAGADGADASAD